jgi:hypothetical protein
MLRLVQSALWPPLPIAATLRQWSTIRYDLAERPRQRIPRINSLLS